MIAEHVPPQISSRVHQQKWTQQLCAQLKSAHQCLFCLLYRSWIHQGRTLYLAVWICCCGWKHLDFISVFEKTGCWRTHGQNEAFRRSKVGLFQVRRMHFTIMDNKVVNTSYQTPSSDTFHFYTTSCNIFLQHMMEIWETATAPFIIWMAHNELLGTVKDTPVASRQKKRLHSLATFGVAF